MLRRIITILATKNSNYINTNYKDRLFDELLSDENLSISNKLYLNKIYKIMCNEGKEKDFFTKLDELVKDINFNSYHYNLLGFYKKIKRKDFDETLLVREIIKRRVFP